MRFEKFSNIIEDNTSNYYKIKKEDYQPLGLFPIIDQGQVFIGGYTDDEKLIIKENLPVIIFGDHTKIFKYVDFPFTIGADGVKVLSLKNQSFNTKFYYYFLKTLRLTNAGYSRHFKYLKVCKLPIPDKVDDQLHIANILTKAENLISLRKESIRLLDEFLKSTFLKMFGDPVRNEKEWEISNIGFQCQVKGGKRIPLGSKLVKEDTGFPYIKAGNIKNGRISQKELEYLTPELRKKLIRYTVEKGDICITVVGVNIGDIGIVPEELHLANLTENANKLLIKDKNKINNVYLTFYLMMGFIQNELFSNIRASGVPKLAIFRIEQLKLLMPPIELQIRFAQIVEKTEALKTQYQQSLLGLENLYGSLSQKAFKGELSFKEEGLMIAAEPETRYLVGNSSNNLE